MQYFDLAVDYRRLVPREIMLKLNFIPLVAFCNVLNGFDGLSLVIENSIVVSLRVLG